MKKIGKILLWILGILAWYMFFISMWAGDTNNGTNAHQLILIITGICLALYIWKSKSSSTLEKENLELKAEIQKLRQELAEQAARYAMEKTESREGR